MRKISTFVYFFFCSCCINILCAQSVVAPSAAQKKVLDKAIPKIIQVLDQFNSSDWEIANDFYTDPEVSVVPSVPLDIDQNFEREYKANQNSQRFKTLIQPLYDRIDELMKQQPIPYDSVIALGDKVKALLNVTVYVYINRSGLDIAPDPKTDIKIPGVAFVHKAPGEYFKSDKRYSYWLGFGNWSTAKVNASRDAVNFKFIHSKNTPYIENIVVIFFGADDRVQELLHKVDWKILDDALTL